MHRILFLIMAFIVAAAPLLAQQAPLPPGAQSPDAVETPSPPAASPALKPKGLDPALATAEDKIDARDYDAAKPAVLGYLLGHPGDARALFDLGYIEDSTGRETGAEADYRKAIAADPSQFEAHAALGLLLAQSGRDDAAAEGELKAAAALEPASHEAAPKAQVWRALAQLQVAADPAAARDSLLQALKLTPGETTLKDLLLTARIAEGSGDDGTAETAYRRALAQDSNSPDATAGLAHLLLKQKNYGEAEPLLRSALEKNPDDPALNSQLASVLAAEDKMPEAIASLEKLHQMQPANPSVTRMLGDAYLQAGEPEKAEPVFAAGLTSAPNDPELLNNRGESLILLKRFAEAIPVLEHATELDPGDADGWSSLAYAYSQTHQDSMTLKSLSMRSNVTKDTPATLFLWATAYDNLHQSRNAAEYYQKFLTAANGKFPDEEWQARHRLIALGRAH